MVFQIVLAQALGALYQQDPAKLLISRLKVIIDDAIIISTPMQDLGLSVSHPPRYHFRG